MARAFSHMNERSFCSRISITGFTTTMSRKAKTENVLGRKLKSMLQDIIIRSS